MNSEELLISFNEKEYGFNLEKLQNFMDFFEKSIAAFNDLKIGTFDPADFIHLFSDPESYLFQEIMRDKPLQVAGMKVSQEKLWDLIEKPRGYFTLIATIKTLEDRVNKLYEKVFTKSLLAFLEYFEFDANNKIQLKSEVKDRIKRSNEVWVKKDSTKDIFKFLKDLEKLFNGSDIFLKSATPPFYRTEDFLRRYLPFDSTEKKFKIDISQIVHLDNNI